MSAASVSRTRRQRGYSFEHSLVERFNKNPYWQARRLGGSSTGFPDVVATNNWEGILLVFECKSTASDSAYVPPDQIQRLFDCIKMFSYYKECCAILAFKFMSKKRIVIKKQKLYEKRKLVEYYKRIEKITDLCTPIGHDLPFLKCDYKGKMYEIWPDLSGKTKPETFQTDVLSDFKLPV